MTDRELDELLSAWRAPDIPASLEGRISDANRNSWVSWLSRGSIRVPVPVAALAFCLIVVLFAFTVVSPRQVTAPIAQSGGLQPVKRLEIRVIRSNYETVQ